MDKLFIVGLGNPGELYRWTRHNAGYLFIDYMCENLEVKLKPGKGRFFIGEKDKIYLVKPTTYMNLSGVAVKEIVEIYNVDDLKELVIVVDDVELPFGRVRMRMKGSSGGHRGFESIIFHLEREDFPRIRIGIGPKPQDVELRDYVLSPFSENELKELKSIFERVQRGIEIYMKEGPDRAMQFINSWRVPEEK